MGHRWLHTDEVQGGRLSHCPVSARLALRFYITLYVIYINYSYTMVEEVIMRPERTGREETASADTSVIKALLSREMCIYTQLIAVSNWEEGFQTGQLASPLSTQLWELHQTKSYVFLQGTKIYLQGLNHRPPVVRYWVLQHFTNLQPVTLNIFFPKWSL